MKKKGTYMWIVFGLLAAVTAAIAIVITKAGLKDVKPDVALAIQAIFIILVAWLLVLFSGNINKVTELNGQAWKYLIIAGVATTFSSFFAFRALSLGEASYVASLERLSLVFAIAFSVLFLKEKLTWQVITGAGLMIAGAVIIAMTEKSS